MVPYDPVSKTLRTDRVIVLCVGMLAIASPLKPQEIEIWNVHQYLQYTVYTGFFGLFIPKGFEATF